MALGRTVVFPRLPSSHDHFECGIPKENGHSFAVAICGRRLFSVGVSGRCVPSGWNSEARSRPAGSEPTEVRIQSCFGEGAAAPSVS
jgi:hypothetical protein